MTNAQKKNAVDMLNPPYLKKILAFSLPLMASGVLQLLYNSADLIVVGQLSSIASRAQAAISSTAPVVHLIINIFMGFGVGINVAVANRLGAKDDIAVSKTVHTAILLALLSGLIVGAIGYFSSEALLELMQSPTEVLPLSTQYLKIYFLGAPFNLLYNFGAATMRAVGDTKRPMVYLMISGLVNVLLNLLLVIVFHMDVAGVAIATVASQVVSMVLVLLCLFRTRGVTQLNLRECRIDGKSLKEILRIGLPAGLQGSLFSVSNVLIQSSVNSFGSRVVAGNGVASNIEGLVYTSMNAQYQADMTFASQNYGAGKADRVRKTLWCCLGIVTAIGLSMGLLILLFGAPLMSLYNPEEQVIACGMIRMGVVMPTYFLCGLMDVMVGQLRGIGYSIMPMIVSLTGACLLRIVWIMTVFAQNHTLTVLYLSYPVSWFVTFAIHFLCYMIVAGKRLEKQKGEPLPG